MYHQHHLHLWFAFVVGQAINVLSHAAASKRSKLNGINSVRDYLAAYWDILLKRTAILSVVFGLWAVVPQPLVDWVSQKSALLAALLKIPPIWPIALAIGLLGDMVLDRVAGILGLRREIPPAPDGKEEKGAAA